MDTNELKQRIAALESAERAAWSAVQTAEANAKPLVDRLTKIRNDWHETYRKIEGLKLVLKELEPQEPAKTEASVCQ